MSVALSSPLAAGASIDVRFLLGLQQTGTERIVLCAEALDSDGRAAGGGCFRYDTAPTAVRVAGASATRTADGVAVRWRTGAESALAGFHVYRQAGSRRLRISSRLLPAHGAFAGGRYVFVDRSAPRRPVAYWIEAVHLDGGRSWYGPAAVSRR